MCPSEAAGKEGAGLNEGLMMVCSALDNTGRDAEDFHFWQQVTLMNQIHLVPIPLASALPIVVILRGASTQSTLMYQAVDGKEQSLQDSSQKRRTPQGRVTELRVKPCLGYGQCAACAESSFPTQNKATSH